MSADQRLQIFIAHAKEDYLKVLEIYNKLEKAGYKPWLDKKDLIPGQNWREEISKVIRESDIFIACLSTKSVSKRGYVQREFKQALKVLEEMPAGAIYLVPIRLEECEVPEIRQSESGLNVRDIHWLDYWEEEGWELLVKAIEYGRKTENNSTEEIAETLVEFIEEKEESQNKETIASRVGLTNVKTYPIEIVKVNERGEIVERRNTQGKYLVEILPGDVELELVEIPGGTFMMGTDDEEIERLVKKFDGEYFRRERPIREVSVSPFLMGKYPITQAQWKAIATLNKIDIDLDRDPSYFKGDERPVETVTWDECVEFCKRLSTLTGREYRLPSEEKWEYGCRAGTTTPFHFGETITTDLANYYGQNVFASEPTGQVRGETTPVGQFPPNAFGLYDMHGNVWEWCADDWHENYEGAPNDGSAWLLNYSNATKVIRGGSFYSYPRDCRSASRYYVIARDLNIGFRVVCVPPRSS